jgi:hypothetical protein
VTALEDMKKQFTAETLMLNTEAQLRYLSPAKAKAGRSFDKQSQVPDDERLEYSMVSVDKYFVNCFNLKVFSHPKPSILNRKLLQSQCFSHPKP